MCHFHAMVSNFVGKFNFSVLYKLKHCLVAFLNIFARFGNSEISYFCFLFWGGEVVFFGGGMFYFLGSV